MSRIIFSKLANENHHSVAWLAERARAQAYLNEADAASLAASISHALENDFENNGRLRDHDELFALVVSALSSIGIANTPGWRGPVFNEVVTALLSRGIALFLARDTPNLDRLAEVSRAERYVDPRLVAQLIAGGEKSSRWGELAAKLRLDLAQANDDEYLAADELERWHEERKQVVPTWHDGNFPRMGMRKEILLSEIFRAADESKWLGFLDRMPLPSLMEALIYQTGVERCPEWLLTWLTMAPRVYEENGARNDSSLVFVLERRARRVVEDYAINRYDWGRSDVDADLIISEMDPAFEELAAAIASRPDGISVLAELGAELFVQAQDNDRQPASILRQKWRYALAVHYCRKIGTPEEVLSVAQERAALVPRRGRWGLWLLAPASAGLADSERNSKLMKTCWMWMRELLIAKDAALTTRHIPTTEWSQRLAALALCSCEDPLGEVEQLWIALGPQRLAKPSDRYSDDRWTTSLLLSRIGFLGAFLKREESGADTLWTSCMKIAVSGWLLLPSTSDAFAEIICGAAYLAAGKIAVADEPGKTYSYLVGERDEANDLTIILLKNGTSPEAIVAAATKQGIDPIAYLKLNRDERKTQEIERALEVFNDMPRSL